MLEHTGFGQDVIHAAVTKIASKCLITEAGFTPLPARCEGKSYSIIHPAASVSSIGFPRPTTACSPSQFAGGHSASSGIPRSNAYSCEG